MSDADSLERRLHDTELALAAALAEVATLKETLFDARTDLIREDMERDALRARGDALAAAVEAVLPRVRADTISDAARVTGLAKALAAWRGKP